MYKVSFQVSTWLQMQQMSWEEWQKCLKLAKSIVEEVRRELKLFRESGDKAHKKKADELKRSLPGACFQASDFEVSIGTKKYNKGKRGRWREQIRAYLSGLVVIDVDHCDNPRELFERIKSQFDLKAEGILLVYISASGEGLKIVFRARSEWSNLICQQYEMASLLGILDYVDDACKDSSRLSFLTGEDDVLYVDNTELFYSEQTLFSESEEIVRTDYDLQYGDRYRKAPKGDSSPLVQKWIDFEDQRKKKAKTENASDAQPSANVPAVSPQVDTPVEFSAEDEAFIKVLNEHYGPSLPPHTKHDRMQTETAHWLCYYNDNDAQKAIAMAKRLDWVQEWNPNPGEVEDLCQSAAKKKLLTHYPKALKELMNKAGINLEQTSASAKNANPLSVLPFERWCDTIEELFDVYPCLREVCEPHPRRLWPFLLFASAAMMGTCMDLTYYYFYANESERTRLNYIIWGVGDPTSGKHSLERLMENLLAPIIADSEIADESTNTWKTETDAKGANKEKDLRPEIYNRMFGYRTSNSEFIRSMINCKEEVDGEMMGRHMVTVSSEKDLEIGKAGSWISKSNMVLLSFHGEYDDQHYSNKQSVSGRYRVFWNMCETFTPPTLTKLVNERSLNSGLDTRTATIPMGEDDFKMMPLRRKEDSKTAEYNETLKQWAYRLDQRRGELPIWPLVEHVHQWCDDHRAVALFNDKDKADWLLIKRVPYYGLNISAPYINMRHWQEREETGTYTPDDVDRALVDLVLDIQYRTQHYWFYDLHRQYYDNQLRDAAQQRRRTTKFQDCFRLLPDEFTTEKFAEVFGYANNRAGQKTLQRLETDKAIERTMRGHYKKLVSELPIL